MAADTLMRQQGYALAPEIGEILSKPASTVRNWAEADHFLSTRVGGRIFIDLESMAKWFESEENVVYAQALRAFRERVIREAAAS